MGSPNRALAATIAVMVIALGWIAPAAVPARAATVINVPADYPSIQAAVDAATTGDTVVVAPGTYTERIVVNKAVTVESATGASTTIIDAAYGGTAVVLANGATLRGFTVRHGGGNSSSPGGVLAGASGVVVEQNHIVDNVTCGAGGGIDAHFSDAVIQDNYIARNALQGCSGGTGGGGILIGGAGTVTVRRNVIEDNSIGWGGGISMFAAGSPVIDGNIIRGNSATQGGGLSLVNSSNAVITNNLIVGNTASDGGGIYASVPGGEPGPTVVNNTIADNTGAGYYTAGFDSGSQVRNNIITGSGAAAAVFCASGYDGDAYPQFGYNDIWNVAGPEDGGVCTGLIGTNANSSQDPGYVNPSVGDYHLRPNSPLIDGGQNAGAPPLDFDGDARPFDGDEDGLAVTDPGFDEATDPLLIDPASVAFGDIAMGATSGGSSVTLANYGSGSLSLTSATITGPDSGDFAKAADTCSGGSLAVHASCTITIKASPMAAGERTADLTVSGPGEVGTRTIPLSVIGMDPFSITGTVAFGSVPLASAATPKPASLTNYGGVPATVSSASISGPNAADFSIVSQDCTTAPVPVAQGCLLTIGFTPHALGDRTATLVLSGPFPVGTRNVALTGTGTAPLSGIAWGSTYSAGPSYSWNEGYGLARSVQGTTQRLHGLYATDRVSSTWAKDGGPYMGVYYTKSSSGSAWTTGKRLNPSTQHAARLGIAAYGSRVYATWVSQTKLVASSTGARVLYVQINTKYGDAASWKSAVRLTSSTGRVDYPTIAASGYDVHIAWTDSVTGSVKVASSTNQGSTWTTRTMGTTTAGNTSNKAGYPAVAVAGNTVAVTWVAGNSGTIRTRISTDRGTTWGTTQTLTTSSYGTFSTAVRSNRIAVAWTGAEGVVLAQRIAGTWQAPLIVAPSDGVHDQYTPALVLQDPNRIGIAWTEADSTANWSNLRWSESADNGSTWFAAQTLGSTSASAARRANDWPSVVWPSASTRYVAWNGWTYNTNYYRLYTRKGTGTPVGIATAAQPLAGSGGSRVPAGTVDGVRRGAHLPGR